MDHSLLSPLDVPLTHTHTRTFTCTPTTHTHTQTHLKWGEHILKKAGRRCSFYLGHIFTSYFIISLPSCLLGSCSSAAPSLKECAFEIYRLSSFPFHLTRSLQPSMWMAKTCKRLEETKRAWVREAWRKRRTGEKISVCVCGGGGLTQCGSPNKANLLFPSGVQQPALFPPSLHPLFYPSLSLLLLKSQMCSCYEEPSALKKLRFMCTRNFKLCLQQKISATEGPALSELNWRT